VTCRLSEDKFLGPLHPVWLPYTLARPLLSTNASQGLCGMMQEAVWRRQESLYGHVVLVVASVFEKRTVSVCVSNVDY